MKILIDIPSNYKERIDTDFENLDTGSIGCTACMFAIKEGLSFPDGATNGDIFKAMFSNLTIYENRDNKDYPYVDVIIDEHDSTCYPKDWWNAPYKESNEHE